MPSDKFYPTDLVNLLQIILNQYDRSGSIFGIPEDLFFKPFTDHPFRISRFGRMLETPIGVAAGPHTQLSQNIVAAWLTGARFIELKTIQTLDELEVSKPCIDMQDEGYNCEWSQELKIQQSFDQYLNAWILIHVLKDKLGIGTREEPGFIFNMSVGYNLEGIMKSNVQWFFEKMHDASTELLQKIDAIKSIYPQAAKMYISPQISDNITLSTMHGCPPDEIEKIGEYLLKEKKLHTSIKLNPTLLGKEGLHKILKHSGFATQVPDIAFEHDLRYDDALKIIRNLSTQAEKQQLHFAVKLTNTLESVNHKEVFPPSENMMYMSGRALHPVSVGIAAQLQQSFDGDLDISFCGGADAFNVADLVACGLSPVTVCSDLLKPGGYGRIHQYIEELQGAFFTSKTQSIEEFILAKAGFMELKPSQATLHNLVSYAKQVTADKEYKKAGFRDPSIKTEKPLGWFDCVNAPCQGACPTNQDVPNYNYLTAKGNFSKAAEVILQTNPFPQTTGMICDHLCQTKCTRLNYDHPVLIREVKRFVAEKAIAGATGKMAELPAPFINKKAAIIGAGPSGLSCAGFLAHAGFRVEVYETKSGPGGMVSSGIPAFRLTRQAIKNDVAGIEALGVKVHYSMEIDRAMFEELLNLNDYIYIAAGAQRSVKLDIEGGETDGMLDPLHFLENLKQGKPVVCGNNVVIIGGGNTAMDVARTAYRLVGENGKVTIVYRRTIREMPADMGEIKAVLDEGIKIIELTAPVKTNNKNGKLVSLTCIRMELGPKDASGRPRPVRVPGEEFDIQADTIIPAVGQELAIEFCEPALLQTNLGSYETKIPGVFIGGDALRGASTAINAIGDGRKAAQEIIDREKIEGLTKPDYTRAMQSLTLHMVNRARRIKPVLAKETPLDKRKNFDLVTSALTGPEAMVEASRCLLCDEVCNICTTVCPNLALLAYQVEPQNIQLQKLVLINGSWAVKPDKEFSLSQRHQILHIADWCNNCGNCSTFCPTAEAPNKTKPHFFLSQEAFMAEDEGFWFDQAGGESILHQKSNGQKSRLTEENNHLVYEFENNAIILNKSNMEIVGFDLTKDGSSEIKIRRAAEMYFILQGARSVRPLQAGLTANSCNQPAIKV